MVKVYKRIIREPLHVYLPLLLSPSYATLHRGKHPHIWTLRLLQRPRLRLHGGHHTYDICISSSGRHKASTWVWLYSNAYAANTRQGLPWRVLEEEEEGEKKEEEATEEGKDEDKNAGSHLDYRTSGVSTGVPSIMSFNTWSDRLPPFP